MIEIFDDNLEKVYHPQNNFLQQIMEMGHPHNWVFPCRNGPSPKVKKYFLTISLNYKYNPNIQLRICVLLYRVYITCVGTSLAVASVV